MERIEDCELRVEEIVENLGEVKSLCEAWNVADNIPDEDRQLADYKLTISTDLTYQLFATITAQQAEIERLKEDVRKCNFMIENGLGWEDMTNDI